MKKLKNNIIVLIFISLIFGSFSCNDEEFLKEVPEDFLSPENAMVKKADFEAALLNVYRTIRRNFFGKGDGTRYLTRLGIETDILARGALAPNDWWWGGSQTMFWETFNPDNSISTTWFNDFYNLILNANFVIERADMESVQWTSEAEKNAIVGEAKFLRAYFYTYLANLYGGVPIVLEETKVARFDYQRATAEEVYLQCKEDLEYAGKWMNSKNIQKSGRAPRAAAFHLLTEVLIQLGDYDGAIASATKVINGSDGLANYNLMTERFGTYKDWEFEGYDYQGPKEPWGDVFWDMFRLGNQNREDGNMEAIWNVQFDPEIEGGGKVGEWVYWLPARHIGVNYWSAIDKNDVKNHWEPVLNGRGGGTNAASNYMANILWEYKDGLNTDMRTSKYNIQREFYWTNPESEFYGQQLTADNINTNLRWISNYSINASIKKIFAIEKSVVYGEMNGKPHGNGAVYTDWYLMRLSETYLLRAEAYMRKGEKQAAADDINVVRSRAHANPADAADIDEDFMLDERARELHLEEFRASTLCRFNKLAERLNKYNDVFVFQGITVPDYLNKWPIPNSFIETNSEAKIEQNPGY